MAERSGGLRQTQGPRVSVDCAVVSDLSVTQQRALVALTRLPVVARLGGAFAAEGFSLYVVGGPVRDALLGTPS